MSSVRASIEEASHVVREKAHQRQGQGEEVIFPVAVDTHRRLPPRLDVPLPGEPDAIG